MTFLKKTLIIFCLHWILVSCKTYNGENYKLAVISYSSKDGLEKNSIIKELQDLRSLKDMLSHLKKGTIKFRITYNLKIITNSNDSLFFYGNGDTLSDSTATYFLPKGLIRDKYVTFLKKWAPSIEIDDYAGNH